MDLVCYRPPYPDELLYGWLKDLARQNYPLDTKGIQRVLNYVFPYRYPPEKRGFLGREPRPLRMDYVKGLDRGIRQLQQKGYQIADPEDIVTYNTPLVAISVALNKGDQTRCIHTAMAEVTGGPFDMPTIHMSITTIRICPCCMRERPYIRTWHNLPGVEVCAVHGIVLESADESTISGVSRHQTVQGNAEQTEFAKLAKTIYDNPRGLTLQDIKDHLPAETALRSPGEQPFERVLHALLAHHIDYLNITAQQNDTRSTYDGATLLSRTGMISTYRCRKCGTVWTDADEAIRIGFRCPQCIKNVPPDTIISEMLGRIGDGKYKLTKPFFSIGGTQDILHETCGQVTASRLELKVWHGTKCRCEAIHTLDSLQRIVDSYADGFTVCDYDPIKGIISLRHNTCGFTMTPYLTGFKMNPTCPNCEKKKRNQRRSDKVKSTMGDDYELIELPETGKVRVRHKTCGTELIGEYASFANGRTCPLCTPYRKKDRENRKVSYEAELFMEMKDWFRHEPLWIAGQHRKGEHTRQYYDALQKLVHGGYICQLGRGLYSNKNDIPIPDSVRKKK